MKDKVGFELTPRQIVSELNRYIVGQNEAKRSVAIALRNRWRRLMVAEEMRDEISPKNIIMIGPTGVGKTEIARRLANLTKSPFIKVEASKYTEVGYVGRDVESIIRDLMEIAIRQIQGEERETVLEKAQVLAKERMLDVLLPKRRSTSTPANLPKMPFAAMGLNLKEDEEDEEVLSKRPDDSSGLETREKLRKLLEEGKLDDREVEIEVMPPSSPGMGMMFSNLGLEDMGKNITDMMTNVFPKKKNQKKVKVKEALLLLANEEAEQLVDMDKVSEVAKNRVEQHGIVFIDEIDKVAGREGAKSGPDVNREGVQRDLLPLVEGSTVQTKYGPVKTDHILFIASGAFHMAKPSDLIPEFQGRFPIRVELKALTKEDLILILTEPENSLTFQYKALLGTENIELEFTQEAVEVIAEVATEVNERHENIGARRLATILERILEELSFEASDMPVTKVIITAEYVKERLGDLLDNVDLAMYIL